MMYKKENIMHQLLGGIIELVEQAKQERLEGVLIQIEQIKQVGLQTEQQAYDKAMECMQQVRKFIGEPEHIIGSAKSKHGEIAEYFEVYFGNARDIMNKMVPRGSLEGVSRTAPEDYLINGIKVQSKFYNSAGKSLNNVIGHMNQYEWFVKDDGFYQIPRDQYEQILGIYKGDLLQGVSTRTNNAILRKIQEIEQLTQKPFDEVVKPGVMQYKQVQLTRTQESMAVCESELGGQYEQNKEVVYRQAKERVESARQITAPSFKEAAKYGVVAAGIGGGIAVGTTMYKKYREGKCIVDFDREDWKEVGIEGAKGGARGGISGMSLYGMTKLMHCPAPLASAVVSTGFGVASLVHDYVKGELAIEEVSRQAQMICVEASMVAIGTAIGSACIPIPIVGSVIGSFAGKIAFDLAKDYFKDAGHKVVKALEKSYKTMVDRLDVQSYNQFKVVEDYYERLNGLIVGAFDFEANYYLQLQGSIALSEYLEVPSKEILHNIEEIDQYFLG